MVSQSPKLKVLLGLTGSVATVLYKKIVTSFQGAGYDVDVIATKSALNFINTSDFYNDHGALPYWDGEHNVTVYTDEDEWRFQKEVWQKGDSVLHIELRDRYSALVIAPCTANTLGKIANGLADNLLTSIARAWDWYKPFIIAPAMNTGMWDHPITSRQLAEFSRFSPNNLVAWPQSKMLACGTEGMGALANLKDIVQKLDYSLCWAWPLHYQEAIIPVTPHPGAFAASRNGHTHTGVDLYTEDESTVYTVEDGVVVNIEPFTGPKDNSPWWEDTDCIMVRGASGVVNYGEITPWPDLKVGRPVKARESIGKVKRVIRPERFHPEITGWKPNMLHLELYPWDAVKASNGFEKDILRDPTPFLLKAVPFATQVTWVKES